MAKKAIISTQGAQNSTLFGEDGEGSLALLISLEKFLTLLTSIVATTNEFNFQLTALQSLEFTNSGKFGYDVSLRPPVRTDAWGGEGSQTSARRGRRML